MIGGVQRRARYGGLVVRLQASAGDDELLPQPVEPPRSIGPRLVRFRPTLRLSLTKQFALMFGCQVLNRPIGVKHRFPQNIRLA